MSSVYQFEVLQNQIELFLCKQLDESNVETLITLSQQYMLPLLTSTIQQFKNMEEIQSQIRSSKKRIQDEIKTESKKQKRRGKFSTDPNIFAMNPLRMSRFFREIGQDYKTDLKFSPAALYEIHKAVETFAAELFAKALEVAKKNSRNEVGTIDLHIAAQQIQEQYLKK